MPVFEKDQKTYQVPSVGNILTAMQSAGWTAYDAYCMLYIIAKQRGVSYDEIVAQKLWNEEKYLRACRMMNGEIINALPLLALDEAALDEESFREYFYTPRQRTSMRSIQAGKLTPKLLFRFLRLSAAELEKTGLDPNEDISGRIAFILSGVRQGDVFFCIRDSSFSIEGIQRRKPACIITLPKYYDALLETGLPVISRSYLKSYVTELAALRKRKFRGKTVAITGSIGKTTTTEMVGDVLRSAMNIYKIEGNQNTVFQIAQFVFDLQKEHKVFVQECSGGSLGQLENTAKILRPDVWVVTNVGHGHIGKFGGKPELLMYEKLSLDRSSAPGAVGVVNWDDPGLRKIQYLHPVIRCAMEDSTADIVSENVVERDGTLSFDVVENNADGVRTPVTLHVCGAHNVYNALSAFAVGRQMGMSRKAIARALAAYRPKGVRQNLVWLSGQHVYIDCYSVTMESMETAMKVLDSISVPEGAKKIAVLSDVPDLGAESEQKHREIGRMIARMNTADEVFFYGPESEAAMEEAADGGVNCSHTTDRRTLEQWLREEADSAGLILFKASHKYAMQWVLDDLYGTDFYCYDELTQNAHVQREGAARYKCIEDYGCLLLSGNLTEASMALPERVNDLPVRCVGRGAFRGAALEEIALPPRLMSISSGAFQSCAALKQIAFPATLRYISNDAFRGCAALETVDLSLGCGTICDGAFLECGSLKQVILPETLKTIGDTAFDADTRAVFHCPAGSYAEQWARDHGKTVVLTNG